MNALGNELAKVAKAIASGISALVGTIVLSFSLQPVDHQGVQYLTQAQWGVIVLAVLASYGVTWRVPNRAGGLPGETLDTTLPSTTVDSVPVPPQGVQAQKGA